MKTVLAAVAGVLLVLIGVHADAQPLAYLDGNMLKGTSSVGEGYIVGVHDTVSGVSICVPTARVPATQLVAIVQKYLVDHPEKLHIRANDLVINALSAAFPCRK